MMIVEGQKVVYAGDTDPFQEVGAPGRVVAMSGTAAHVQWTGGPKTGSIDLVELHELVPDRAAAQRAASVAAPTQHDIGLRVRASFDAQGEEGVVTALDESGHLAMLADEAENVVSHLAGAVLTQMGDVLASLEVDERDIVARRVASVLLADCLKES